MSSSSRLFLVLGCLVLAAIELPHGATLLADDLPGPYGPRAAAGAPSGATLLSAGGGSALDEVSARRGDTGARDDAPPSARDAAAELATRR